MKKLVIVKKVEEQDSLYGLYDFHGIACTSICGVQCKCLWGLITIPMIHCRSHVKSSIMADILLILNTSCLLLIFVVIVIKIYFSFKIWQLMKRWNNFFSNWNVNIRQDIQDLV